MFQLNNLDMPCLSDRLLFYLLDIVYMIYLIMGFALVL